MSGLEKIISKWNFKKIAIIYIVVTLVAAIGCITAAGIVFRDRISFAWQYSRVSELAEENNTAQLKDKINKLATSSSDVVDILVLDSQNSVTYSAKNSQFSHDAFTLSKVGDDKNYLVNENNSDVVFKYVKGDEFMLSSVFNKDFSDIKDEYDNESFYENGFSNKTVYMLNYVGSRESANKIYIINNPTSVPGGMMTLKIDACVAMLLFMIYWVLLALWAYQNAAKAKLYPLFWGLIVLFTNLVGVIVYQLYKRGNATCTACGASQSKAHIYCMCCGEKLGDTCVHCGAHISKKDCYCTNCGKKQE